MGLSCRGCQEFMKNLPRHAKKYIRKYTGPDQIFCQREFLEHVTTCEDAQRLWNLNQEGARTLASERVDVRKQE